jgi:hypothetical protein
MPITGATLEPLINMLNALAQRQDTVRQLTAQLHGGAVWRSPDGSLAVDLTTEQRAELAGFAKAYLDRRSSSPRLGRCFRSTRIRPWRGRHPRRKQEVAREPV